MLKDTVQLLQEITRVLSNAGRLEHRYMGECPDETAPDSRDLECATCAVLVAFDAWRRGR